MLRRPAERILVNSLSGTTIHDNGDNTVTILGARFPKTAVVGSHTPCVMYCATGEVKKQVIVTVDIPAQPSSPVEEVAFKIRRTPNGSNDLHNILALERTYIYNTPDSGVATNAAVAKEIARQINADPNAHVTAKYTTGDAFFILTGKADNNFDVYAVTEMAILKVAVVYKKAVLSGEEMNKLFPIGHESFGSTPELPIAGATYCKYVLKTSGYMHELSLSMDVTPYQHDFEFYVNAGDSGILTNWVDKLKTHFGCTDCSGTVAATITDSGAGAYTLGFTKNASGAPVVSWSIDRAATGSEGAILTQVEDANSSDITTENLEANDVLTATVTFPGCKPVTKTFTVV